MKARRDLAIVDPNAAPVSKDDSPTGTHAHALEREHLSTKVDGGHSHAFRLANGDIVVTAADGAHQHTISNGSDPYGGDGSTYGGGHSHAVQMPDGTILHTAADGHHRHDLQVSSTGFDGTHQHSLTTTDGATVLSLTASQMWMLAGSPQQSGQPTFGAAPLAAHDEYALDLVIAEAGAELELAALGKRWRLPGSVHETRGGDVSKRFDATGTREFAAMVDAKRPAVAIAEPGHGTRLRLAIGKFEAGLISDTRVELWISDGPLAGQLVIDQADGDGKPRLVGGEKVAKIAVCSLRRRTAKLLDHDARTDELAQQCGLPDVIAKMIPADLRWWDVAGDAARERRELVRRSLHDCTVRPGPDGFTLVREAAVLEPVEEIQVRPWTSSMEDALPAGRTYAAPFEKADWRAALAAVPEGCVAVLDPPDPSKVSAAELVAAAKAASCEVIVCHDDLRAADVLRELGRPMQLRTMDAAVGKRVFASTIALGDQLEAIGSHRHATAEAIRDAAVESHKLDLIKNAERDAGQIAIVADVVKRSRFVEDVAKANDEERFVYGIVLEPNTKDAQDDVISETEIRNAAHGFMENFRNIGLQHQVFVNDKVAILESFISPADFTVGDETVLKGSWLMGWRIRDDELWKKYRDGDLTGFSIGGTAIREPIA